MLLFKKILNFKTAGGLIDKRGTWLSFEGQQLGQGRDAARDNLKTDPAMQEKLVNAVKAKAHEKHGFAGAREPVAVKEE